MGRNYDEKSILKTATIRNVLLNEKDYIFQDFKFKIVKGAKSPGGWMMSDNYIEVYNFGTLILRLRYENTTNYFRVKKMTEKKHDIFEIKVVYFNPQTNNDCQSINHIIAVLSELTENTQTDRGNASVISNQYVFRRKDNFYSYTKVWIRGDIQGDNYNKDLSHEFSTEEYINHIKNIFGFTRMPRRNMKKRIKNIIDKAVGTENKRLLLQALEKS